MEKNDHRLKIRYIVVVYRHLEIECKSTKWVTTYWSKQTLIGKLMNSLLNR